MPDLLQPHSDSARTTGRTSWQHWVPVLLAAALIAASIVRNRPESWLIGALGLALLVRTAGDAFDSEGRYRRTIVAAYLAIAALGLIIYLVLSG